MDRSFPRGRKMQSRQAIARSTRRALGGFTLLYARHTRCSHEPPILAVVAVPDAGMRLGSGGTVKEEDAMSIGRKRRLFIFGSTVCVGMLGVGGYLYAQPAWVAERRPAPEALGGSA